MLPQLDFMFVDYLNNKYIGVTSTAVYSSDDGITWVASSGLPAQTYSQANFIGNYVIGASNGVYWSADGVTWTQSTGISVTTNVVFGSLAGTTAGIYVTTNNGQSYAVTSLASGSITCIASSNNVFVAGTSSGILYSQSGTTWTAANVTSGNCVKVSYINQRFIMIMSSLNNLMSTVVNSVDGVTWTACKNDNLSNVTVSAGIYCILALIMY